MATTLATTNPTALQNKFEKYGAGILSFIFAVLTALGTLTFASNQGFVVLYQLIPILVTGAITWLLPLSSGKWAGGWKTGLDILSAISVILIPIAIGTPWPWHIATWILIATALVKISLTEFGVYLRTSTVPSVIDAGTAVPGVPSSITNVYNSPAVQPVVETAPAEATPVPNV